MAKRARKTAKKAPKARQTQSANGSKAKPEIGFNWDSIKSRKPGTGYPWQLTEEILDRVRELAAKGLLERQIAFLVGITPQVFSKKKREYPELLDAIEEGRALGVETVAGHLFLQSSKGNTHATLAYLRMNGGWNPDATGNVDPGGPEGDSESLSERILGRIRRRRQE